MLAEAAAKSKILLESNVCGAIMNKDGDHSCFCVL
jgi:hypothetical protein